MHRVLIHGWHKGFRKVEHTRLLQTHAGLGLCAAKALTDRILDGEAVEVGVPTRAAALELAGALREIGAVAEEQPK